MVRQIIVSNNNLENIMNCTHKSIELIEDHLSLVGYAWDITLNVVATIDDDDAKELFNALKMENAPLDKMVEFIKENCQVSDMMLFSMNDEFNMSSEKNEFIKSLGKIVL